MKSNKSFFQTKNKPDNQGLVVSFEELLEQRKYIKYINNRNKDKNFGRMSGDIRSAFKGRGIEFEEIRPYEFGDETRDIDWKVTARKNNVYTKVYNEEHNRDIYIFLDLSQSMVFGTRKELKSVSASKLASLLAWSVFENKDRLGCVIYDGKESHFYKASSSRENLLAILKKVSELSEKILSYNDNSEHSFEKSLSILQSNLKSRSEVFIISDFSNFEDIVQKSLSKLSKHHKTYILNIYDEVESKALERGEYMVSKGDDSIIFNSNQELFNKTYCQYFVYKRGKTRDFCLKNSAKYIPVITGISLYNQIKIT